MHTRCGKRRVLFRRCQVVVPRRESPICRQSRWRAHGYSFAVLLNHRVNPNNDPFLPALSIKAFEAQVKYLAANYTVLSLYDIIEWIREGRGLVPEHNRGDL
jgi:hypothetical protein